MPLHIVFGHSLKWYRNIMVPFTSYNSMQTQGPQYNVPTGRRDGRVSNIADANNMPQVRDPINVLKSKFAAVGLSDKDLVLLSGN
jgi:Peroxidase